jgi:hypothetical protein
MRGVSKLSRRYQGIYKVVSRTSEGDYVIESIRGKPLPTPQHPTRLRVITPAIATLLLSHPDDDQEDVNIEEGDENEFKVNKICAHKTEKKGNRTVLMYEIEWEGFAEHTWEPEDNVYADEKLAEYWNSVHARDGVHTLTDIKENQLLEKISTSLRYIPSHALQRWIGQQVGRIDVDVAPSQTQLSFCIFRLSRPLDHKLSMFYNSKSIWIDIQWDLESSLFSWITDHCSNKLVYTLLPEWMSLPNHFKVMRSTPLPSNILWFTHPDGTPSTRVPTPHWRCSLVSFTVGRR